MLSFFAYLNGICLLAPEAQAALLNRLREKDLRKGQVWLQEGAVCDKLGFIEKGLVKVYFESGSKEVAAWFHRENDILLCAQSYFNQSPSPFSIRAVEPCKLYYVRHQDLLHLLEKYVALNVHVREILQRYYSLSEAHVGLLLCPPRERLQRIGRLFPWMADQSRLTDRMLAAYIGVTPACVSYYRTGRKMMK